jgi:hypothetical protein
VMPRANVDEHLVEVMTEIKAPYFAWMNAKNKGNDPLNKCAEWTKEMQEAFPELQRVRGHVILNSGMERPHWWLTAPDGTILDPTSNQFCGSYYGGQWIVGYLPFDESKGEPKGKCMVCSADSWYESAACSPAHLLELDEYYGGMLSDQDRRELLAEIEKEKATCS